MIHLPGGVTAVSSGFDSHPDMEALIRENHAAQLEIASLMAARAAPRFCIACRQSISGDPHECPPETLGAIAAAETRAERGEERFADELRRPIPERLAAGLRILFGELEP